MSKILGYLILCTVASLYLAFGTKEAFKGKKAAVVIGSFISMVGILFATVIVVHLAMSLIL